MPPVSRSSAKPKSAGYIAVVGGVNVDICGRAFAPLRAADSNPGTITRIPGGVGRNIAHNLRLMGVDVRFLTALGDDADAHRIAASCKALGIDISCALHVPGASTSTYMYITGPEGEMALALSDMEICERITPDYLAPQLMLLNSANAVIADANIPQESLLWLAENCTAPLFADPVSTAKAEKLCPILGRLHTLKPNRLEAELFTGIHVTDEASASAAAEMLLETGLKRVFISLGSDGVFAADDTESFLIHNIAGKNVSTTGCGDAFTAALAAAYTAEAGLRASALAGLAAASIAMESTETVNPAMSAEVLRLRIAQA